MRPEKLILCGWGPYSQKVEIDFSKFEGRGVFLITGPTGAGKTTLFDGITYALYGALSGEVRDKERSSVRSDFAHGDTPTYVELTMKHGGKRYIIRRNPEYMRPKKRSRGESIYTKEKENAVLYLPDESVIEGVKEVNSALLELLVLDVNQFKQISMIAQGEFARLLTASPKEKTKIFREIFGTGIYDRFTMALSTRAKKLYACVMELKHKLEEDIRLLGVGLEKSGWSPESRELLTGLTEGNGWNYQELEACLDYMEREAENELEARKKGYSQTDRLYERLTRNLTKQVEENRKVQQYLLVLEERKALKECRRVYQDKEKKYNCAQNAGWVESADERAVLLAAMLEKYRKEAEDIVRQAELLGQEAERLLPIVSQRERLELLIRVSGMYLELLNELKSRKHQQEELEGELKKGQIFFLEQTEICREKKARYEAADEERKLNAIGIAASLLEEGRPCPVCGSTSHPSPAPLEGTVATREELGKMKKEWEAEEQKLASLHDKLVSVRTQVQHMEAQAREKEVQSEDMLLILEEGKDEVSGSFLTKNPHEAGKELQMNCSRMEQLKALMEEKEKRREQLARELLEKQLEKEQAEQALAATLAVYGFSDREDYLAARLRAEERQALKEELEEYKKRVSANQELFEHMQDNLKNRKAVDTTVLEQELAKVRIRRQEFFNGQKLWDRHLTEVKKTRRLMNSKKGAIEEASEEYGYVKDLENMAVGNNSRKLVFEQYVLAGYFEEILAAANLRFRKMTLGRYEMSRVSQVGDGRVKDNLEIQVMDFYTGKYRSVRTLSGGESFKASLCLALGMSDVIQAASGGIKVDTMFIDEGFGALDSESLDQACETLMGLTERNQMIGIISHVPELRERIGNQLIIERTGSGSRIIV